MKSIGIRLIFCTIMISIFGDAVDIKLYLSEEYGDVNNCSVCLIDGCCLEWDYVNNDNLNGDYGVFNACVIHDNSRIW